MREGSVAERRNGPSPAGRPPTYTEEQQGQIVKLRKLGLSYNRIAAVVDVPVTTIEGLLRRKGMTKKIRPLDAGMLGRLYEGDRLSMPQIAHKLRIPKSNVEYWMRKHGIPRRPLLLYPRYSFSGDINEKAYIIGLKAGDLYARKYENGILVSTTTTHLAMLNLFHDVFGKYGHISNSPAYNRATASYQWTVRVVLDSSFAFLLRRIDRVPNWIACHKVVFLHFLAGFADAEGSITIVFRERPHHGKSSQPNLSLSNSNKGLLLHIASLMKFYRPRFRIQQRGGLPTSMNGHIRRKDQWEVNVGRKSSLRELLSSLPLRHSEKIQRASVTIRLVDGLGYSEGKRIFARIKSRTAIAKQKLARKAELQLARTKRRVTAK